MLASPDASLLASTDSSFEIHCAATVFGFGGCCSGRETALPNFGRSMVWGLTVNIVRFVREKRQETNDKVLGRVTEYRNKEEEAQFSNLYENQHAIHAALGEDSEGKLTRAEPAEGATCSAMQVYRTPMASLLTGKAC